MLTEEEEWIRRNTQARKIGKEAQELCGTLLAPWAPEIVKLSEPSRAQFGRLCGALLMALLNEGKIAKAEAKAKANAGTRQQPG